MATQEAQVKGVQDIMANVQAAYDSLNRGRATLNRLIQNGVATCQDVKVYNLQARAVWAYQESVAGIIRQQGGQAPVVPLPVYVGWRGISGDRFADVDCSSPSLAGPGGAVTMFVDPRSVEWRQEVIPTDAAYVRNLIDQAGAAATSAANQAGLGAFPVAAIPIIIVGVFVTVALVIVLKIAEVFMDIPGKRETTKQIAAQATAHDAVMQKRESCYTSCVNTGKDRTACARDCARLYETPKYKLPEGMFGGLAGKIAGVAVVGILAYAGYRFVKGGGVDRLRDRLPSGDDRDDDDGVDVGGGMTVLPARRSA
jgi:hypothetical protein